MTEQAARDRPRLGHCGERHGDGCGAEVLWVRTESGRWMPLDPRPVAGGNIYLDHNGQAGHIARHALLPSGTDRYVSHFATCPAAKAFRRKP